MSSILVSLTFRKVLIASVFGVALFLIPNGVQSAINNSATLHWATNEESDLAGYTVYHGTSPGIYSETQDAGKTATFRYADLEADKTHFFTVTAYDASGNESLPSPEVQMTIIAPDSVLSVLVSGEGTVKSSPAGLSCSSGTCSGTFTQGSSVTLTAAPGVGNIFSGWKGPCSGTGACAVAVSTTSAAVSANFVVKPPPPISLEQQQRLAVEGEQLNAQQVWDQAKRVKQQQLEQAQEEKAQATAERLKAQQEWEQAKRVKQQQLEQAQQEKAQATAKRLKAQQEWEQAKRVKQQQLEQAQQEKAQATAERLKAQQAWEEAKRVKQQQLEQAQQEKAQATAKRLKAQQAWEQAKQQKAQAKAQQLAARIQEALGEIEIQLVRYANTPTVVARLNEQKEKYSVVLAKIHGKYSMN